MAKSLKAQLSADIDALIPKYKALGMTEADFKAVLGQRGHPGFSFCEVVYLTQQKAQCPVCSQIVPIQDKMLRRHLDSTKWTCPGSGKERV